MERRFAVLLLFFTFLAGSTCLNWMAGGNWTYGNLTTLKQKIQTFDTLISTSTYAPFATSLSTDLNTAWAPAWNVVIYQYTDGNNYDAVLYGYAFNGHWFWLNGFLLSGSYYSFIIWKDYNCVKWFTYDDSKSPSQSSYSLNDASIIGEFLYGYYSAWNLDNIWQVGKNIQ